MRPLSRLRGAEERLDQPDHDPSTLDRSLHQVADVNRWLGAGRALLHHVGPWIRGGARSVLDVGTGSGDLPRALHRWARRRGYPLRIVAVDAHPQIARLAASASSFPVAVAKGDSLPFRDRSFDIVLLSMTLHHAEGAEELGFLREMARVSSRFLFVGELRRSRLNLVGARLLAGTIWRSNPLTRHDGPVSVMRGYTPDELETLALEAGLARVRVHRHWFQRLALIAEV